MSLPLYFISYQRRLLPFESAANSPHLCRQLPHPFPLLLSLSTRQSLTSTTRCRFRYSPSHTRGGCYHLNLPPTRPISSANSPIPFPFYYPLSLFAILTLGVLLSFMTLYKYIFLFPSTLFNNKLPFRPSPL